MLRSPRLCSRRRKIARESGRISSGQSDVRDTGCRNCSARSVSMPMASAVCENPPRRVGQLDVTCRLRVALLQHDLCTFVERAAAFRQHLQHCRLIGQEHVQPRVTLRALAAQLEVPAGIRTGRNRPEYARVAVPSGCTDLRKRSVNHTPPTSGSCPRRGPRCQSTRS